MLLHLMLFSLQQNQHPSKTTPMKLQLSELLEDKIGPYGNPKTFGDEVVPIDSYSFLELYDYSLFELDQLSIF